MIEVKLNSNLLKNLELAINQFVRPDTFPLAVKMVKKVESLPERTKRPKKEFGHEIAICQLFSIARRYGWQVAAGEEDIGCPLALTAFGFKPETAGFTCGEMCGGMYTESNELGAKTEAEVPRFSFQKYRYILCAPISRAGFSPDFYLIYGNTAQVMRLVTAYLWKQGGYISSRFSGRLDCADIGIETIITKKPQVILPCYGDRVFGQTQDFEMAFTFPAGKENDIIEGFKGTHKGGIRYPTPSFLKYKPEFPKHYYRLFEEWKQQNE